MIKIATSLVFAFVALHANANTIHFTTHNLVPYSYYDESGEFTGVAFTVLECALSDIDYDMKVSVVPWQRAQNMVKSRRADGFFAGSQKDERDAYATMTVPIADQNWTWFWPINKSIDPPALSDSKRYSRSSFLGANMQSWLEESGFKTLGIQPTTTEQLVEMVKRGRVDVGLANQAVLEHFLEKTGERDRYDFKVAQEKPLGAYIHKDWLAERPGFLSALNASIDSCRE